MLKIYFDRVTHPLLHLTFKTKRNKLCVLQTIYYFLNIITDMFVLLLLVVVIVGAAEADISWHRPSREGLQSVRDFCSGRGPLDTAEDLFSSSFGKLFASSWSGTEART